MLEVIPGILEKDWSEIAKKLEVAKSFTKIVHIDIIDGKFAPNATFLDPMPFSKYSQDLSLEVHMMVKNPIQYLESFAKAGFKRFLGHIEQMPDQAEFVAQGQLLGEVGLAIDGPTSLDSIKVPFSDLDAVLIYTCDKAGFSGPPFVEERLEKVKEIRTKNAFLAIEVDGGINDHSIVKAREMGADRFVSTSFIFGAENPLEQYSFLKKCLE